MFAKRPKKSFPPGTFIPGPARVMAILQLCIAFTMILGILSYPFMGALFEHKSRLLLYRTVLGDESLASSNDQLRQRLQNNRERFSQLPEQQQASIIAQYHDLQARDHLSFFQKLVKSVHIFLFELPVFELAWIIFSIVISIMLLLRIAGAAQAVWLLPLLVILYGIYNSMYGVSVPRSADEQLFPTEEVIVRDYLKKELPPDIAGQQEQLLHGWKLYLIQQWAHEQPSADIFEKQAEKGDFKFNVARLELIATSPIISKTWNEKESPLLLICYFVWNVLLAWIVTRSLQKQKSSTIATERQ